MQSTRFNQLLGERIAGLRADAGLSQVQLAKRLSAAVNKRVDPTTITRMERGARPTSVTELAALAEIFGVAPWKLFPEPSGIERAAEQLTSAWKKLDSELKEAQKEVRLLAEHVAKVEQARDAANRVRDAAISGGALTNECLADLETLAKLGAAGYLRVHFIDIIADLLGSDELGDAEVWVEDIPVVMGDETERNLGFVDYLRNGRPRDGDHDLTP